MATRSWPRLPHDGVTLAAAGAPARLSVPLLYRVLAIPLLIAGFSGLPRLINVGPMSAMGALTIVQVLLVGAAVLGCGAYPVRLLQRLLPYFAFLAWIGVTLIWARPDTAGFQNGLIYLLFVLLMLLTGTLAARDPELVLTVINRAVTWISIIALSLVALELKVHGLTKDTEEGWWIGPRPLAILGVVVMARELAKWYYGDRKARLPIILWMGAIVVSVSRSATAIGLLLIGTVVLAQTRFRLRRAILTFPALVGAFATVACLALFWPPLHDHMFGGDAKLEVGGTKINVSGRWSMWSVLIDSGMDHPYVGGGLGSSVKVITTAFAQSGSTTITQPHNDYLRIWHDTGAIGLTFYLLGVVVAVWVVFRDWYRDERAGEAAQLEFTALLTSLAICASALTDNPLVYPSVAVTAGVFIGAGLGAGAYRVRSAPRPSVA
jgi:O-antigen ligase